MGTHTQKPVWRYLDTGFSNGYENMAIDEAILLACQQGSSPPTIRMYGWIPPALSLGYFQNAQTSVDLEACAHRGIDVVRRLSGGRAVLHDKELTYSLTCPEGVPPFTAHLLENYRMIGECLLRALTTLSLKVEWAKVRDRQHTSSRAQTKTASCFSAPSWYELTVDGKKICGSAQKRGAGVFLQHGSILIEHDPDKLAAILHSKKNKQTLLAEIHSTTTSINHHLNEPIDFFGLQEIVLKSFEHTLGISLTPGILTAYEIMLKEQLMKGKYLNSAWNLRRKSSDTPIKKEVAAFKDEVMTVT